MAKNAAPAGAPMWIVTFADLMSLLVCFFVLIISFSVADTKKLKIVAGSMRDAFGFQREMVVTGMVEIDGNPRYEYASDLVPTPVEETVGPVPDDGDDIQALSRREDVWEELLDPIEERSETPPDDDDPASEDESFDRIEQQLRQAMQSVPELELLADHLQVERSPEGLRIQIVDQLRQSMFPLASATMYPHTRTLLRHVTAAISSMPNQISIAGHTDSLPFRRRDGYDNWSLSLDRADATRRQLVASGLDPSRIATIIGKADTDHLFPATPRDPRNRRISITLLREQPPTPSTETARPDPEEAG